MQGGFSAFSPAVARIVLLKEGEPLEDDQSVLYIPRPVAKVSQLLLLCGVQHVSHNCCYAAYSKFHLRTMYQTHPPRRSSKKLKTESGGTEHNVNDPAVGSASVECLYNPRRNPPSGYQITSLWNYAFNIECPSSTSIFASRCHLPRVHYQID